MFASVMTTKGRARRRLSRSSTDASARSVSCRLQGCARPPGREGQQGHGIAFFESEKAARAGGEARDRLRKEAASATGTSISNVESYEVVVATGVAAHTPVVGEGLWSLNEPDRRKHRMSTSHSAPDEVLDVY